MSGQQFGKTEFVAVGIGDVKVPLAPDRVLGRRMRRQARGGHAAVLLVGAVYMEYGPAPTSEPCNQAC